MGFFRFALAIGVVFYHLGDGAWVVGRTAVFCFYLVSGFLICRVLDQAYWGSGSSIAAFYCNRALRLLPLYAVVSIATILLLTAHGSTFFPGGSGGTFALLNQDVIGAPSLANTAPIPTYTAGHGLPVITADSTVLPQGWSVAIELVFYVFAPALVLSGRRQRAWLVASAVAATCLFVVAGLRAQTMQEVDSEVYKNAITSAFMFIWGAAIYVVLRDTKFRVPFYISAPIIALFVAYIYFWAASKTLGTHEKTAPIFVLNVLLTIPVSAMVCLTVMPERLRKWETRLGDLTYGIYLNHFLVAAILLWIAEVYGAPVFGRYNTPVFGISAAIACILLALATLHLVERPIERLRRLIKKQTALTAEPNLAGPAPELSLPIEPAATQAA
jgi:peptidoglycan/LPS O-acetylase OafA/YrhL